MEPTIITSHPNANEQLLYFTTPSLTADNRHLIFLSDRTGDPNIFLRHLPTGTERQLSANREGTLKSYVYFGGNEYRGLGKASVSLDPYRGMVYYIQGRDILQTDLWGKTRILAELPDHQVTAFTHISADGRRLCVPTTDARALEADKLTDAAPGYTLQNTNVNEIISNKPNYDIDQRVREENLRSYLRVYDTQSGKPLYIETVPQAWITHVQFSPVNPDLILYNHEWPMDCGINRLWLWDGRRHLPLRSATDGRSRQDWTCHEMWEPDGRAVIYHGKYADGAAYIGRVLPDGSQPVEIRLPGEYRRYGHFTMGNSHPDWLVSDGYYQPAGEPGDANWGGAWISIQKVDWNQRRIEWIPLGEHHSPWDCQDSHPHPVFDHADQTVFFTSFANGKRVVAKLELSGS